MSAISIKISKVTNFKRYMTKIIFRIFENVIKNFFTIFSSAVSIWGWNLSKFQGTALQYFENKINCRKEETKLKLLRIIPKGSFANYVTRLGGFEKVVLSVTEFANDP